MRQTFAMLGGFIGALLLIYSIAVMQSRAQPLPSLAPQQPGSVQAESERVRGQTLYVPVYSHIYYGGTGYGGKRQFFLAVTVSLRNTDPQQAITITSARYYDTEGQLLQEYLTQPLRLGPLVSTSIFIEQQDVRGGSGANFIVEWQAETPVPMPLIEAVMIGTAGTQGLAFTSPSRVLQTRH